MILLGWFRLGSISFRYVTIHAVFTASNNTLHCLSWHSIETSYFTLLQSGVTHCNNSAFLLWWYIFGPLPQPMSTSYLGCTECFVKFALLTLRYDTLNFDYITGVRTCATRLYRTPQTMLLIKAIRIIARAKNRDDAWRCTMTNCRKELSPRTYCLSLLDAIYIIILHWY